MWRSTDSTINNTTLVTKKKHVPVVYATCTIIDTAHYRAANSGSAAAAPSSGVLVAGRATPGTNVCPKKNTNVTDS